MVTVLKKFTVEVATLKVAVELPAGTVTLGGTVASELLADSPTEIPPAGAALLKVTVPVEGLPPTTEVGSRDTDDNVNAGVIVSCAVAFTPAHVAVIVAVAEEVTGDVVTVNETVELPALTLTCDGTVAEEMLLDSPTEIPPLGAGPLKVMVPVDGLPPVTVAGFREINDSASAGLTVS